MEVFKARSARWISNTPGRLYRALPSVVLGTLFNVLDTVSTGLLVFPSDEGSTNTFQALQIQALSMYIMSTILSQVAMTLGGSRFPGALGAMLIEILPFLRGIATDIRSALGSDNPALVPTVMAAYAMTSFLIGAAFIILGLLKLGNLVAYFPQTVLTGAIGAIGVSLFILGLGLTLPPSSPGLTLSSAGSVLFNVPHLPLLAASFLPAFILSVTLRSPSIDRWTRGLVQNAYYVPIYLFSIPVIFWIVVGSQHTLTEELISNGWLFRVDKTAIRQGGLGTSWIYWREFDFSKVEWSAMKHAITNIVLLVVIGVLNLPIYVPALAFSLDVPYDMNHEFFGQGVANILAGVAGTIPSILQYSYSVFFTRANGGRFEMTLVIFLTFILFLTSGLLLPYIPTVLASALVLFLGIELFLEAVWESAKTLAWLEWGISVGTLLACTFLGFAEGFGVGIGAATAVYLAYGVIDSPARVMQWEEWNERHRFHRGEQAPPVHISPLNHTPSLSDPSTDIESVESLVQGHSEDILKRINARVVVLAGYVFFATIPSLETKLIDSKTHATFILVDMLSVHRLETSAAQCFSRAGRDLLPRGTTMVLSGIEKGSGVHADFERAGVRLIFEPDATTVPVMEKGDVLAFRSRQTALAWCLHQHEKSTTIVEKGNAGKDSTTDADIYQSFCTLFDFNIDTLRDDAIPSPQTLEVLPPASERFVDAGGRFVCYAPGQTIIRAGDDDRFVFIIEGQADVATVTSETPPASTTLTRPSIRNALIMLPQISLQFIRQRLSRLPILRLGRATHKGTLASRGDMLDCNGVSERNCTVVALSRCVTVEVKDGAFMSWARSRLEETEKDSTLE